jgi:hypothetical protein
MIARLVAPLLVLVALASACPGAAAKPLVLRAAHNRVTAIGPWKIHQGARHSTVYLANAIRALGRPSSRRVISYYCRVSWRRLGVIAHFTTLGGMRPGQTMCTPSVGLIDRLVIRGRRWRTWRGLRIGAPSDTIPDHHHAATFEHGAWTLARWINPGIGDVAPGTPQPMVTAAVHGGRVSAFRVWIGAEGE